MNIAIIVYGPLREFELAHKTWGVLNELNSDFYFSTWDKSEQSHPKLGIEISESFDEDYIKKYFPKAKIKIHDESKFESCVKGKYNINIDKMIFHWKYGLKMIQESGEKYDILILLRPDLYFNYHRPSINLCELNKPKTIYGMCNIRIESIDSITNDFVYFVNDVFLMGNYEVMSNLILKCKNDYGLSIHDELAKEILGLGYYVKLIDGLEVVPIRPNSRKLNDLGLNELDYLIAVNDHISYNKNLKE